MFTLWAAILPLRKNILPPIIRPGSFDNDQSMGPFRPNKLVWPGEQRRGISMHIADAISIADHVLKSSGQEFSLANDIPLPAEMADAAQYMKTGPPPSLYPGGFLD